MLEGLGTKLRNLFCYCGLTKEEFKTIRHKAYVSDFEIWKRMNLIILLIFASMIYSHHHVTFGRNVGWVYWAMTGYALVVSILFFKGLKKDSPFAHRLIYVTMSLLMLGSMMLSFGKPNMMAVSFIAMIVLVPAFVVDKPYYMITFQLATMTVYLALVGRYKSGDVLTGDVTNVIIFTILGIIIGLFNSTLRAREFLLQKQLQQERDTDYLTRLSSRRRMVRKVEQCLREEKYVGHMIVLDVDNFKSINDRYGHDQGDAVLRSVGDCIRDVFQDTAYAGRFGGDEFVLYMPNCEFSEAVIGKAGELMARVKEKVHTPNPEDLITLSVGIARQDADEQGYDTLFKKADTALYQAKDAGRNCWILFTEKS